MVNVQHIEESLSISYVNAVVSKTGQVFDVISRDYGVDGSVRRIGLLGGDYIDMGAAFDCQLKASKNCSETDSEIIYDINADAYNKLIKRSKMSTLPCFLILFCLPQNEDQWLNINEQELVLKKCCYYFYVNGELTSNNSSKRLKIPKSNIFDCEAVINLMELVAEGDING